MGLGDKAFTYTTVTTAVTMVTLMIALFLYDKTGRRPIMITGAILQIPLMIVVALGLLWALLGPSAIAGIVIMVTLVPINSRITTKVGVVDVGGDVGRSGGLTNM